MSKTIFKSLIAIVLLLLMPFLSYAASVHKWVDENGVTHYSDQAPEHKVSQVEQLEITDSYNQSNLEDDYYSVSNQWARMHAERVERKKLQLEKAKLKQSHSTVVPQVVYLDQEQESRSLIYYPVFAKRFGRYGNHYQNVFQKRFKYNNNTASFRLPRNNQSRSGLRLTVR